MIGFFPAPYEDELFYSWLARYYERTGYIQYISVASDLFKNKLAVPKIEFINELTGDAVKAVTRYKPIENIILDHTLYPYYARFLPKDEKKRAYKSLARMDGKHFNLLPVPNKRSCENRVLRYCPKCANEDRAESGETYWHRIHQLVGLTVCPKHNCILECTHIPIKASVSPNLIPAESVISCDATIRRSNNAVDLEMAKYLQAVFLSPFDFESNVPVSDFLQNSLQGSPYISIRGEKRDLVRLLTDFNAYYQALSAPHITEWSQLQKLMQGVRLNPFDICLMGNFLKIPVRTITKMTLPKYSMQEQYDRKIKELHAKGLKYPAIADIVGGSYDYVKSIGEGKRGRYNTGVHSGKKTGPKVVNTKELDQSLLPLVRDAIQSLQRESKPVRISAGVIERKLGLVENKLKVLPLCKAEIEKHRETQEAFWIRKILWSIEYLRSEGHSINKTAVMRLTNLDQTDIQRCINYINDSSEEVKSSCRDVVRLFLSTPTQRTYMHMEL